MDRPVTEKLGLGQTWNHSENALLLGNPESRLKAHQIPHTTSSILLTKLHYCVCLASSPGIAKSHRLEGTKTHRVASTLRHHFDRHASLEIGDLVEFVSVKLIGGNQSIEKRLVLVAGHRAVEISAVFVGALHPLFTVARATKHDGVVNRLARDDRCDRVVEGQRAHAQPLPNGCGELVRCERTRRDYARGRNRRHFLADDLDSLLGADS